MTDAELLKRMPDLPTVRGKLDSRLEFVLAADDILLRRVDGLWVAYE